jgi:spermidine synthase
MPARRRAILQAHALFCLSGALGLAYEVLWMRRFTALFGSSSLAVSATLSAVFLGLAAGSAAFGRWSRSFRRPLLAFGALELGVGAGALLTEPLLDAWMKIYPGLHASLAPEPGLLAAVKLALAFLTLALPTVCMGGTLPALARFSALAHAGLGVPVGGFYAINLAGAVAGTLAVPFVLLPWLGVRGSLAAAVGGSVLVGLSACLLGRNAPEAAPDAVAAAGPGPTSRAASLPAPLLLAALSGAATLALQVLWARAFALVHANSVQAFAVVLATFLSGLAGGAGLARHWLRRGRPPAPLLGAAWVGAGLLAAIGPALFHRLTGGLAFLGDGPGASPLAGLVGLAAWTVLPSTLALGTVMPLVLEGLGHVSPSAAGRETGRVVAANTLGAIAGPFVATFVLAPHVGLWTSLFVLGVVLGAAGAWASGRPRLAAGAGAGFLLVGLFGGPWHLSPVRVGPEERLVSVREDSHGTTAVLEDAHDRWITVNNSYVLGGTAAATEERFQAHLPLLLHPAPRDVALVGLGTGITASAALDHPVERLTVFEIVPEVAAAARADFAAANGRLLEDPRVSLVADDARPHLVAARGRFDVIVADLLVPWRPGEASLYTVEHLAAVRRALRPGGLFCQWLPVYQLADDQLSIAVRTFVTVFPRATLWRGNFLANVPTLALLGHTGPALDTARIDERTTRLAPRTRDPFLAHRAGLWLFLVGPLRGDEPFSSGRINSDGRPWLELLSASRAAPHGAPGAAGSPPAILEAASAASLRDTPLETLDAAHDGWRRLGAELHRATYDRSPEHAMLALLRRLPHELQRALGAAPQDPAP